MNNLQEHEVVLRNLLAEREKTIKECVNTIKEIQNKQTLGTNDTWDQDGSANWGDDVTPKL